MTQTQNATPLYFLFEGEPVHVFDRNNEPWFVAKDVAELLRYADTGDAIRRHCKGAVKHRLPTKGGEQDVIIIIPERDVYRLVMRSKLPAAERFENWVVSEVLPQIRKTGRYAPAASNLPTVIPDVSTHAGALEAMDEFCRLALARSAEVRQLQADNARIEAEKQAAQKNANYFEHELIGKAAENYDLKQSNSELIKICQAQRSDLIWKHISSLLKE